MLDDGSERSIVLSQAVDQLNLPTEPETLRTVHHDVVNLHGATVSLQVSPLHRPCRKYLIPHAFTADNLGLSERHYPVSALRRKYEHLRSLPLPLIDRAQPLLLLGSDLPHLLTPVQPVCMGPQMDRLPSVLDLVGPSKVPLGLVKPPFPTHSVSI